MRTKIFRVILSVVVMSTLTTTLTAHPSWGIVVDTQGNIYYVDVLHGFGTLWKIDADRKTLTQLTDREFHAHSLSIDQKGTLWTGLEVYIEGLIEGDGHHYLVSYDPSKNRIDTVIFSKSRQAFAGGVVAVDAKKERVYFADHGVRHRTFQGPSQSLFPNIFERFCTMTLASDGTLWIVDSKKSNGSLYTWSEKKGLSLYADNLMPSRPSDPAFREKSHHIFYGIGFLSDGTPLTTDAATRQMASIGKDGCRRVLYQSPKHFFPVGVFSAKKKLYVMECGYDRRHLGPHIAILNEDGTLCERLEIDYETKSIRSNLCQ